MRPCSLCQHGDTIPRTVNQPMDHCGLSAPALDMLQGAAQRLAKIVEKISGGRFRIEVFPGGQSMPPPV